MSRVRLCRPLIPLLLVLPLTAAACGGDDTSSPGSTSGSTETVPAEEWATTVCESFDTWGSTLTAVGTTLQGSDVNDVEGAKDLLDEELSKAIDATEQLTETLSEAGRPEVENADEAVSELDAGASEARTHLEKARSMLADADGQGALVTALPGALTEIQAAATALGSAITSLESLDAAGELEAAFTGSEACNSLGGG